MVVKKKDTDVKDGVQIVDKTISVGRGMVNNEASWETAVKTYLVIMEFHKGSRIALLKHAVKTIEAAEKLVQDWETFNPKFDYRRAYYFTVEG